MAGIAGDLFLKLYLVILVSGKLALRGWFGILETYPQILWSICHINFLVLSSRGTMMQHLSYQPFGFIIAGNSDGSISRWIGHSNFHLKITSWQIVNVQAGFSWSSNRKDFLEALIAETGEFTRTVLREGLFPGGVSSSRLYRLVPCFGGVVPCSVHIDSFSITVLVSSNSDLRLRIFWAQGLCTRSE